MTHEIHLTARAAEILLRGRMKFPFRLTIPDEYFSRIGLNFCGAPVTALSWTVENGHYAQSRVEDVRALLRNETIWRGWDGALRRTRIPSCPVCSVALDQLITHFQQRTDT